MELEFFWIWDLGFGISPKRYTGVNPFLRFFVAPMAALFLAVYLLVVLADLALDLLNLRHLRKHGNAVPPELEGFVDDDVLERTMAYTAERTRLGIVSSAFATAVTVLFLFTGAVALYDGWIATLSGSFVWGGVLFFLGLAVAGTVLEVPFSLWSNFVIEKRYDFNRKTFGLWAADAVKGLLLAVVLAGGVTAGVLAFLERVPDWWWLWAWGFVLAVQFSMMFLAPYILRLYFRYEPIRGREDLEEAIRTLVEGSGFRLKGVYQVDSSRRTTHTNAFFTGFGASKRIALFDTLVEKLDTDEILGVLAHEIGHWKMRHTLRGLATVAAVTLAGLYVAYRLLAWGGLPDLIGFSEASVYVQFVILSLLSTVVTFPLEPLRNKLSRRKERQADRYAVVRTGKPESLASALAKLARDNLSNLHPHPLYASFHYSHPPTVERIQTLQEMGIDEEAQG